MKKLTLIISALALFVGLSQCKKPNQPIYGGGGLQTITFSTSNDGNGAKGDFLPSTNILNYKWTENDKIYVYASFDGTFSEGHSQFCGILDFVSCTKMPDGSYCGVFNNTITMPYSNGKVMFAHYGQDVTVDPENGTASTSFAEQNGKLTVTEAEHTSGTTSVSSKVIAMGSTDYSSTGNYSCSLDIQFAVARFSFENFTKTDEITLSNISNNSLSVDKYGKVSYSGGTTAQLNDVNSSYYVVLMPENDKVVLDFRNDIEGAKKDANSGIAKGFYYTKNDNGDAIPLNLDVVTTNALPGVFSVDNAGTKVYFGKGNVQYQPSTQKWRMAEHQYDIVGDATVGNVYEEGEKCNNRLISSTYTGWIDLLAWATSGKPHSNPIPEVGEPYQPYFDKSVDSYYKAYNSDTKNLYDDDGTADWGVNFTDATWFTPSANQWWYLVTGRTTANGQASTFTYKGVTYYSCRYMQAKVEGIYGLIIFPDRFAWTEEMGGSPSYYNNSYDWSYAQVLTSENFAALQKAGVAFIPAAGFRYWQYYDYGKGNRSGSGEFNWIQLPNQIVDYWTSNGFNATYSTIFQNHGATLRTLYHEHCHGFAVRLITKVPEINGNGSLGDFNVEDWE